MTCPQCNRLMVQTVGEVLAPDGEVVKAYRWVCSVCQSQTTP